MSARIRIFVFVGCILFTQTGCSGFRSLSGNASTVGGSSDGNGWSADLLGGGTDTEGRYVAVDSSGNVYLTGWTSGAIDGNTRFGSSDLFLTKYDATGVKQWTKELGASGLGAVGQSVATGASGIAVDSSGNVYIEGLTTGNFEGNTLAGLQDSFLAKFDSTGTPIWTKQWGCGTGCMSCPAGIAVDGTGNIFITETQWTASTPVAATLMKFEPDGSSGWQKAINGAAASAEGRSLALDALGNIVIGGWTAGGLNGNTQTGAGDGFVAKYDSAGNVQWVRQFGVASTQTSVEGVAVDLMGNVALTGYTEGGLNGNAIHGIRDLFVSRYDSSGGLMWGKQLGQTGGRTEGHAIALDSSGNIVVGGDSNMGVNGATLVGAWDDVLTKYDPQGDQLWFHEIGVSSTTGVGGYTFGYALTNDALDNTYFVGTTDVAAGVLFAGLDAYVNKYNSSGIKQ